jgi:hypothetical protein
MTAANSADLDKVRRFQAAHGEAWGLIEESGMEREHHTGAVFATFREAVDYRAKQYDPDEIEAMHVDVARWDAQGEFWTYDF